MTGECPTPAKHRYATAEAARVAAQRTVIPFGRVLNPYACACDWVHLSSLAPAENYQSKAAS